MEWKCMTDELGNHKWNERYGKRWMGDSVGVKRTTERMRRKLSSNIWWKSPIRRMEVPLTTKHGLKTHTHLPVFMSTPSPSQTRSAFLCPLLPTERRCSQNNPILFSDPVLASDRVGHSSPNPIAPADTRPQGGSGGFGSQLPMLIPWWDSWWGLWCGYTCLLVSTGIRGREFNSGVVDGYSALE